MCVLERSLAKQNAKTRLDWHSEVDVLDPERPYQGFAAEAPDPSPRCSVTDSSCSDWRFSGCPLHQTV